MISWNVSRNDITLPYLICSVVSLHFVVYTCLEQAHLVSGDGCHWCIPSIHAEERRAIMYSHSGQSLSICGEYC